MAGFAEQRDLQCSVASNLNASTYRWEVIFVVIISTSCLVLFIYVLRGLQATKRSVDRLERLLQMKTDEHGRTERLLQMKTDEHGRTERLLQKMINEKSDRVRKKLKDIIEPSIRSIISKYSLPNEMEQLIKDAVKEKLQDDEDFTVDENNIFSLLFLNLPSDVENKIKRSLVVDKLQRVPKLKDKGKDLLEKISEHFKPVIYTEESYIIQEGQPLDTLFFIALGIVLSHGKNETGTTLTLYTHPKPIDDLYGKELIDWAENISDTLSNLPISPSTVKAKSKVVVFAIKAADLKRVVLTTLV